MAARKKRTIPDRVMTKHPAGKKGVRIARDKYEEMRRAILRLVPRSKGGVSLADVRAKLPGVLDRKVFGPSVSATWYLVAVKQDLEARGAIEIVRGVRPQHLRRTAAGKRG